MVCIAGFDGVSFTLQNPIEMIKTVIEFKMYPFTMSSLAVFLVVASHRLDMVVH